MTLKVGLSGAGPAGLRAVQDAATQRDCDFVAVHDDRDGRAAELARRAGLGFATHDFDALLGAGVDFVVLTGPLEARLDQVRRAAEQAVPCMLHAPAALDLHTARAIAALGEEHEVRIGVHVRQQADPVVEQLRRMIAGDWLGGVTAVQSIVADDELLRTGDVTHRGDPFVTMSSEHVHLTSWLTGRRAASVTAQRTRSFSPDLDDGGVATVLLRGNIPCTYTSSRITRADAFAIHGTDGGLRMAGDRVWLCGQRPFQGHVFDYETTGIEQVFARRELEGAIGAHRGAAELHGRFARWLEDSDDFPCPIEQAVEDYEALDAMGTAATEARQVTL